MPNSIAKHLSECVAHSVKTQKIYSRTSGRVIMLALRQEIKQALADGWSAKAVWQTLVQQQKITIDYSTFSRHLRRGLLEGKISQTKSSQANDTSASELDQVKIKDFVFNQTPNKEELL